MTLWLSRVRLARGPDLDALRPLLDPSSLHPGGMDRAEQGRRSDAHHRLIWTLFADRPDRAPEAFRVAGLHAKGRLDMAPDRAVRLACRDAFRRTGLLSKIIPGIEAVLAAGELPRPEPPPEALGPAFPDATSGDEGHRG